MADYPAPASAMPPANRWSPHSPPAARYSSIPCCEPQCPRSRLWRRELQRQFAPTAPAPRPRPSPPLHLLPHWLVIAPASSDCSESPSKHKPMPTPIPPSLTPNRQNQRFEFSYQLQQGYFEEKRRRRWRGKEVDRIHRPAAKRCANCGLRQDVLQTALNAVPL